MVSAVALGLLAGAGKAQTVKADTTNTGSDSGNNTANAMVSTDHSTTSESTTSTSSTSSTTSTAGKTDTTSTTGNTQSSASTGTTTTGSVSTNTPSSSTSESGSKSTSNTSTGSTTNTSTDTTKNSTGTTTNTNTGSATSSSTAGTSTSSTTGTTSGSQTNSGSTTGQVTSGETTQYTKSNVSEDVSNENIGEGSAIYGKLTNQTAKDNFAKLNDTAKKILSAAIREGSSVELDKLTDKEITALNKMTLTKTEDSEYTMKDYDSITSKIVNREASSQIPLMKGDKIENMPGLASVKDAETGENAKMEIWDSWPVQDPESGYVENWNGYQLVVAMMGIPHKSDSHLYLLYNKYGDNNFANWKVAGSIFGYSNDPSTGQWSGSAMLNSDGSIQLFYADVHWEEDNNQKIATATIYLNHDNNSVSINRVENNKILFTGDGTVYQNYDQWKNGSDRSSDNPQLRDAHVFKDSDGTYYLAFETATGNNGDDPADGENMYEWGRYGGNASYNLSEFFKLVNDDTMSTKAKVANGAIGFLKLDMSDPKNPKIAVDATGKQELYKPLVKTILSGDEIERPDLIKLNGKYYLFTDGRLTRAADTDLVVKANTTIGDNVAMLGFVSDRVDGGYVPLNGDGLVLGASVPSTWRTATYSYYVVKINPKNLKSDKITVGGVTYDKDYFVNHVVLVNAYMSNRAEMAGKDKDATLGPSFLVLIDGNKSKVLAESTTDQGVWDWNEGSAKPEFTATSVKEAKASTDSYIYQVKIKGYNYLYKDTGADGSIHMQTGFQYVPAKDQTYYYDPATGHMLYGFQKIDGKTYYLDPTTGARVYGQVKIDGQSYYFDANAVMQTGFQKIGDKTYYYDATTGQMLYGLQKIGDKTYYFDPTTGAEVYGQIKIDGHWYYFDKTTGAMLTGFQYIDSQKKTVYYDPATGQMLYGLQKIDGKTYCFNAVTGAKVYGQVKMNGKWYYFDKKTGAMLTGFQYIASQKKTVYYDPATGQMLYGFHKISGKTYYFNPVTGARYYGQAKISGHWYLFDKKTGVMQTGFKYIASQKKTVYYDTKTGRMVYGLRKISGKWYIFDKKTGAKISYQKVSEYLRLKTNSALYTAKGKKTKAKTYKKGKFLKATGVRVVKGKLYYKLTNGKYIKAGNATVGKKRTLKKNAYIYTKKGKKLVHAKKALKKGTKKVTYGSVVVFKGKKYYAVANAKYVKAANF
ncbi:glycoside hydrolase family 68 protein [Lactobacillus sp.]|uniref:glycoside hydrolase family 68 protein n=1 Tax=Lactobacillus sp. TaxID=1591 RepID=UPI003EF1D50A